MGEYVDTQWDIYLERARYLLNIDELLEEMQGKTKSEITDNIKVEFGWNAGTEQLLVCSDNCRKYVAIATA